jgi:hypothetical protein
MEAVHTCNGSPRCPINRDLMGGLDQFHRAYHAILANREANYCLSLRIATLRNLFWERRNPQFPTRDTMRMKKHPQFFISKGSRRSLRVGITIGIDLGDVRSHYCTLNEDGGVSGEDAFARMLLEWTSVSETLIPRGSRWKTARTPSG